MAATAAIPAAYWLAIALGKDGATSRLTSGLVATLPALVVFAPKVDQLFAPIALVLLAATLRLLQPSDSPRPVGAFNWLRSRVADLS